MILQTGFGSLIDPASLTIELSIVVGTLLIVFMYASVKMRSAISMVALSFSLIILMATFVTQLSFFWFWISSSLTAMAVSISMIIYWIGGVNV